ncbi:ATPase, F0 complex, subunit D, mitochondrial [Nannochloropsis gaditana]|uniref:ATPase, F0 complex, subunit D, mitochondrial n=1 Tax=Nannochloropsis gaditana TaxID=72520 RepID=W7U348_9STRA|nr:ATPase, F0 complex, subunit D, mitochondrial [Nannochloropsis gaditana]
MASTVRGIVSRQQALWMRTAAAPVSVTRRALSNWDALGRKVEADVEAKADFNALKNQWDGIEKDFNTWSKEVAPIDWAKYKNNIEAPGFVDFLKERYEGIDWSQLNTKLSEEEIAADAAGKAALLEEGKALVAAAEKLIEETQAKMHLAATKRTNKDSLVQDVWEKNPAIKQEVLDEIENHQWFKDVK